MNSFLSLVSIDVLSHYGQELSNVLFILPNRRSAIKFKETLADQTKKPIWSPEILAINDWIIQTAEYAQVSELESMFALFQSVSKYWPDAGSMIEFLSWGEMLQRDFDEIDKYLVDAGKLYVQLSDEKEIENRFSILEKDEIQQYKRFWKGIKDTPSAMQSDWLNLWNKLADIYKEYHRVLSSQSKGSAGMMYRNTSEQLEIKTDLFSKYAGVCFIGFNALTKAEKHVFKIADDLNKGRYYWDAINYLSDYVKDFPNPDSFSLLSEANTTRFDKKQTIHYPAIEYFAFESSVSQVKMVSSWLDNVKKETIESDLNAPTTAIVLGEEGLLDELLWSLNQKSQKVNVSFGKSFILTQLGKILLTLVNEIEQASKDGKEGFSLSEAKEALSKDLLTRLKEKQDFSLEFTNLLDPVVLSELLSNFRTIINGNSIFGKEVELSSLDLMIGMLTEIIDLGSNYGAYLTPRVWLWYLKKQLNTARIPFPSIPGSKIQVTGILETRVLDYDNLIVLSVNEGIWPANKQVSSFIPYHLRKEFGLPVIQTLDKMYAYHFFRLLQRSNNIKLGYISMGDNIRAGIGEKSRFLLQLEHEYKLPIIHRKVIGKVQVATENPPSIPKDSQMLDLMKKYFVENDQAKFLSPSAINTYIDCPLRFVYQNLLRLRDGSEKSDLSEPRLFGTALHETMEWIYTQYFSDSWVSSEGLKNIFKTKESLEKIILKVLEADVNRSFEGVDIKNLNARNRMVLKVLENYVGIILATDKEYAPFKILGSEEEVFKDLQIQVGHEARTVRLGGIIDRLDQKGEVVRVIDYKSGQPVVKAKSMDELTKSSLAKRPKEMVPALLYAFLIKGKYDDSIKIVPGLYAMRHLNNGVLVSDLYLGGERLNDQKQYYDDTEQMIREILHELFNPEIDFKPTENVKNCEYCSFNQLCQRV